MLQYSHTKFALAEAVARNLSKTSKYVVWVFIRATKSVSTIKLPDTTVISVCSHHEIPADTGKVLAVYYKGKKRNL